MTVSLRTLTCEDCGNAFEHPPRPGRPPRRCHTCRHPANQKTVAKSNLPKERRRSPSRRLTDERIAKLSPSTRKVMDALARNGRGALVKYLAEDAKVSETTCIAALAELEIAGLARVWAWAPTPDLIEARPQ
jgi:hypothetical protein